MCLSGLFLFMVMKETLDARENLHKITDDIVDNLVLRSTLIVINFRLWILALLDAARRFYGLGVWYLKFADDININAFFFFFNF